MQEKNEKIEIESPIIVSNPFFVYSGHSDPPFRDTDPPLSEVQFFKEHFKEHREDANLSFFS